MKYTVRYTEPVTMTVNRFSGEVIIPIFDEYWSVTCEGDSSDELVFYNQKEWCATHRHKDFIKIDLEPYTEFSKQYKHVVRFQRDTEYMEFALLWL